jgi:phenylpropionate dioxygenase-like ring-hydroxylating dioxygenase large terminal subunit
MMSDIEKRFPFDAYPKGWFQVAYSREVDAGQVIGLHYFGRRLICYRGDSGPPPIGAR